MATSLFFGTGSATSGRDLNEIRQDVAHVKTDIPEVKTDLGKVKERVGAVEVRRRDILDMRAAQLLAQRQAQ